MYNDLFDIKMKVMCSEVKVTYAIEKVSISESEI